MTRTRWIKGVLLGGLAVAALGLAQAAAAKDTITLGLTLEPPHLDPTAGAAAAIDEVVYANVFEGLTRIDSNGVVQPALAKSWSISADGLTYTFKLQQGVKFHDGTAMDSADVKFSLERALADDSTNAQKGLFKPISKVAAPDPGTVVVTLKQPTSGFLFNLGWGDAVIVAPESAADNKTKPVGTGPFTFTSWTKGDSIKLTRNPDYWGKPAALAAATFKYIPDPAAQVAALLAGDIDAVPNTSSPEAIEPLKADPRFTVAVGTTEGETIMSINNARKPFDDVRVRRALAYAIDRQAIVDGAMFGYGTPIGSHFAPHHPAYKDLTGRYPHDPAKAKALLAEAGLADGFKATLKLPPPTYARRGGEVIQAQLAEVGIQVELIPVEWAQWLDQVFKQTDYDLTIVSHTEPLDIGIYGRDSYYFNYHSDVVKGLLDDLDKELDTQKRYAILGKLQEQIADDAVNVFLFQLAKLGVWDAKLQGLWENSPVQANDLTAVHWTN